MKIINAEYENWKNVPDGKYDLNGKSVLLIADNTFGKTNFMRGLRGVLGASPGKNLIKEGEEKATVTALLAEFENDTPLDDSIYKFRMVVKKVKGDEKISLQVTMPDGTKDDTKTMIGKLAGEIELSGDFVTMSNTADGKRKQLEIVKSYLEKETIEFLNAEAARTKVHYDARTDWGRDRDRLHTLIESSGLKYNDFDLYKEHKPTIQIEEKITNASKHNTTVERGKLSIIEREELIIKLAKDATDVEEEIKKLQDKKIKIEQERSDTVTAIVKTKEWLADPANKAIEVMDLQTELKMANEHNTTFEKVKASNQWKIDYEKAVTRYGELTALYDTAVESIKNTIRDLVHPIPGLSFDMDGNVFYNGKLVSEDTLSTAESMMVNIALKRAKQPKAKVVFIDRGESLGLEYMQQLQQFAEQEGYQLIMEEVKRGKNELTVELMPKY